MLSGPITAHRLPLSDLVVLRFSPMPHAVNPYDIGDGSTHAPPTWVRWRIVALLMAYSFMSWFNRVCMAVAADDQIMPQSGISPEAMGTVYSSFFLAYTICMTPGGWVADRFGPRTALALMGFGSAIFVACTGLAGLAF